MRFELRGIGARFLNILDILEALRCPAARRNALLAWRWTLENVLKSIVYAQVCVIEEIRCRRLLGLSNSRLNGGPRWL
jgi:hypothetical protein